MHYFVGPFKQTVKSSVYPFCLWNGFHPWFQPCVCSFADEKPSIAHSRFFVKAICVRGSTLFVLMYVLLNMAWQSLKSPKCSKSWLIYVFFVEVRFLQPPRKRLMGSEYHSSQNHRSVNKLGVSPNSSYLSNIPPFSKKNKTYGAKSLPSRELTNTSYIQLNGERETYQVQECWKQWRAHTINVCYIFIYLHLVDSSGM